MRWRGGGEHLESVVVDTAAEVARQVAIEGGVPVVVFCKEHVPDDGGFLFNAFDEESFEPDIFQLAVDAGKGCMAGDGAAAVHEPEVVAGQVFGQIGADFQAGEWNFVGQVHRFIVDEDDVKDDVLVSGVLVMAVAVPV